MVGIAIYECLSGFAPLRRYVCKTLFTDASLVNKIVGFHKGRQTIKKKSQGRYLQKDRKGKKEEKINSMHIYKKLV